MYVGPTGCGKTTQLKKEYLNILKLGIRSDRLLVLTPNANQADKWRQNINIAITGKLNINTFLGFIQKELRRYWNLINESKSVEPVFLNIEASKYLMQICVNNLRSQNRLMQVSAPAERAAEQLIQDITGAALSGFNIDEIYSRMSAHWDNDPPHDILKDMHDAFYMYNNYLTKNQVLDYARSLELYRELLENKTYKEKLTSVIKHLIVDDIDESIPAQQDFIELILPCMDTVITAYSTTGGHGIFWGAHPSLAWNKFKDRLDKVCLHELHTSSTQAAESGNKLYTRIIDGNYSAGEMQCRIISEDLHNKMLDKVSIEVLNFIEQGTKPNEISVISPYSDRIMELQLRYNLEANGCKLENLTKGRKLSDEPFAQALVTLAILSHPGWNLTLNYSDVANTLKLVLGLDPVRSSLLSEAILTHNNLPELDEVQLRDRIGFGTAPQYEAFYKQVQSYREKEIPIDVLLQRIFSEILCTKNPREKDTAAVRQLIMSAMRFVNMVNSISEMHKEPAGKLFINMIVQSTKAADTVFITKPDPEAVLLSTPYSYLTSRISSRVQVWLDTSSQNWFRSDTRELGNPYILSRDWDGDWGADQEIQAKKNNCARTVRALLHRCGEQLIVAESRFSRSGFEQNGPLTEMIGDVLQCR